MNTALTLAADSPMSHALAYAQELAKAELLPTPYQRKPAMILMAMEIARDLGCSVVAVMNGTYDAKGKLSFYTDFMLAQARRSGVIRSVSYESSHSGPQLAVTARAVLQHGEVVEATYTMREADSEGLTKDKQGKYGLIVSKYKTMPEQMLRKRALSRLIRNYCPEVLLGGMAEDEAQGDSAEAPPSPAPRANRAPIVGLTARASTTPVVPARAAETVVDAEPAPAAPDLPTVPPELEPPASEPPARRPPATDERVAEVLDQNVAALEAAGAEVAQACVLGPNVRFNSKDKLHRTLVTRSFDARQIPGGWRNLHREKLQAFLDARDDLRAVFEDVDACVEEYILAHPPGGAK
jgi:RecT family